MLTSVLAWRGCFADLTSESVFLSRTEAGSWPIVLSEARLALFTSMLPSAAGDRASEFNGGAGTTTDWAGTLPLFATASLYHQHHEDQNVRDWHMDNSQECRDTCLGVKMPKQPWIAECRELGSSMSFYANISYAWCHGPMCCSTCAVLGPQHNNRLSAASRLRSTSIHRAATRDATAREQESMSISN